MSKANKKRSGQPGGRTPAGRVRPDIAERVLRHFQQNAQAMDSVEGIARFWVREDPGVVEACLLDLHARGLLEKRTIAGADFYLAHAEPAGAPAEPARSGAMGAAASGTAASIAKVDAGRAARSSPTGMTEREEAGLAPAPERRGRILVVDDDPIVLELLVKVLQSAGHEVTPAESGTRALEIFRADPRDVVVTDILMPGISGLDVLQSVRQVSPGTEVIVVTAFASLDNAIQALRHGAYDFISKPLDDLRVLERVVERALEKRRLTAENRLLVGSLQSRNVELKETVARLAAVNDIGRATTGMFDLDELCGRLVRLVAQHLKARRVSVLISEPGSDALAMVASVGITDLDLSGYRMRVGEGIAGRVAASQAPLLVTDIDKSPLKSLSAGGRYSTPSFVCTPLTVSYPIRYQRKRVGVINVSDKHSGDPFTEQDLEFLSTLACQVAVAIENAHLIREMEEGYQATLAALAQTAEDRLPHCSGRSRQVARVAAAVARTMGLHESRVELLVKAAMLRGIGRLVARPASDSRAGNGGSPDGQWTQDAAMATERILAPIASLREVREIILHSGAGSDAAGSPFGAARPGVPVEARILKVCEEFIRLTSGNGHDAEHEQQALETIRRRAGREHDSDVLAALHQVLESGGVR
jgi:response regulator RpfG family c-di-GMP phosphodiesterase